MGFINNHELFWNKNKKTSLNFSTLMTYEIATK